MSGKVILLSALLSLACCAVASLASADQTAAASNKPTRFDTTPPPIAGPLTVDDIPALAVVPMQKPNKV